MARVLRSIPAVLALLLLAAHFYRASSLVLAVLCVAATALAFTGPAWAVAVLRTMLAAGSVLWVVTAWQIARARLSSGMPYLRLLAILGAVAVFTAIAAWALPAAGPKATARTDSRP